MIQLLHALPAAGIVGPACSHICVQRTCRDLKHLTFNMHSNKTVSCETLASGGATAPVPTPDFPKTGGYAMHKPFCPLSAVHDAQVLLLLQTARNLRATCMPRLSWTHPWPQAHDALRIAFYAKAAVQAMPNQLQRITQQQQFTHILNP